MILKDIKDCDIINYKKPSLFIAFPHCTFKCDKENGNQYCQNWLLTQQTNINIDTLDLIEKYYNSSMVSAIVCGGLEPFDNWIDLYNLVFTFRIQCGFEDDVVIYTGFEENEIYNQIQCLKSFKNIIIKFGRYRPNQKSHFDELIGVNLASDNQYSKKIS